MLTSPGWRVRPSQRTTLLVFSLALMLGGITTALALWLASGLARPLPGWTALAMVSLAGIAAVMRDVGLADYPLPENRRLIPQELFREHPVRAAGQFGFELGTGVRTYLPATSPYLLALALLVLTPGFWAAMLAGVGFGLGRAFMIVGRYLSPRPNEWDFLLTRRAPTLQHAGAFVTAAAILAAGAPI